MDKNIEKIDALPKQQIEIKLYKDVCSLIENTRQRLATTINAEACILHWQIGKRIKEDVLFNKRAEYGKQVIKNLAIALVEKYGKGWGFYKLQHCVRCAYTFSEDDIRYAVSTQLNWTPLRSLMSIDDELKRSFYMEMCHCNSKRTSRQCSRY